MHLERHPVRFPVPGVSSRHVGPRVMMARTWPMSPDVDTVVPLLALLRAGAAVPASSPFVVFWHRAGNSRAGIEAVQDARARSSPDADGRLLRHGVECDLKWTVRPGGGALHLYLHHGPTGRERLDPGEVRRHEAHGRSISLETALDLPGAEALDYMVEVKRGHGPRAEGVGRCVEAFERRGLARRLLLAASSLPILEEARRAHPEVPRCLFVSRLFRGGRALHVPKVEVLRGIASGILLGPRALSGIDAISSLGPLRSRRCGPRDGPVEIPRVDSLAAIRASIAAGDAGAFAYARPAAITA